MWLSIAKEVGISTLIDAVDAVLHAPFFSFGVAALTVYGFSWVWAGAKCAWSWTGGPLLQRVEEEVVDRAGDIAHCPTGGGTCEKTAERNGDARSPPHGN